MSTELPTWKDLRKLPKDDAIDLLFEAMDEALWEGDPKAEYPGVDREWPKVYAFLNGLKLKKMRITLIVSVFVAVMPIRRKDEVSAWAKKAAKEIRRRKPEGASAILEGLMPKEKEA